MAWSKAKIAVVTCAALLLVAGTSTVIVEKITSPSVDESLWSINSDNLAKAPPVLILRPTRYPNRGGSVVTESKIIGQNLPVSALIIRGYDNRYSASRIILPPDVTRQHYDLMLTLPDHGSEALREKIRKQLGLTARREIREADALLLKVRDASLLDPKISKGETPTSYWTSDISFSRLALTNQPLSRLASQLEGILGITTIDQTGLTNCYDIGFQWDRKLPRDSHGQASERFKQVIRAQLDLLGLELISSREPIETLVVEKAK